MVGLMRNGTLLIEDEPSNIKQTLGETSLETCFLKLCQSAETNAKSPNCEENTPLLLQPVPEINVHSSVDSKDQSWNSRARNSSTDWELFLTSLATIRTLLFKSFIRLRRNYVFLIFAFTLPPVMIFVISTCLGPPPRDLNMAVVNFEDPEDYSRSYLDLIDPNVVILKPYPDQDSARLAVRKGAVWGVIHIPQGFSSALSLRMEQGMYVSNNTLWSSTIRISMDMSNQQIMFLLQKELFKAFETFSTNLLNSVGVSDDLAKLPIKFVDPIYGSEDITFTEFILPGFLLSVSYFLAISLTILGSLEERRTGLLSRCWVHGVNSFQVQITLFMTQFVVFFFQLTFLLVFTYYIFQVRWQGSAFLIALILLLQGCYGMTCGQLISSCVENENTAVMIFMSTFYPSVLLSGCIWPTESQMYVIRFLSHLLPQTIPTSAIRSIVNRGWGIEEQEVWLAIVVMLSWIAICLLVAVFVLKMKK